LNLQSVLHAQCSSLYISVSGISTILSVKFNRIWSKRKNGVFDPHISGTGSDLTRDLGPGTAAISRRRQSIKPQVAVKLICDRPAADYDSWRRRR